MTNMLNIHVKVDVGMYFQHCAFPSKITMQEKSACFVRKKKIVSIMWQHLAYGSPNILSVYTK